MKAFEEIIKLAKEKGPKKIVVAAAEEKQVLKAIKAAIEQNIVEAILVGDELKIRNICKEIDLNLDNVEIFNVPDVSEASRKAVSLVSSKKADIIMKGFVDTSIILKAILDKEIGLRTGKILSHAAVFELEKYHKILFITDAAMNISPNLDEKKQILENTVELAHALGINKPKVAVICAKEKVNTKMIHTVDAAELVKLNKNGNIQNCLVAGPFALDNAISKEASEHKKINSPVAGDADILLMPNIETGNVLYKSLTFFSNSKNAGILLGTKAPVVLTSRSDTEIAKLYSIALGVLHASL